MKRVVVVLAFIFVVAACGPTAAIPGTTELAQPTTTPANAPSATAADPTSAATALAAGALTIATLGDSLTEGQGDDSGIGYPGRLKALIDAVRPGTTIFKVGHSGWSSSDLINGRGGEPSELTQAIAAAPNVALVWIGSNDLWYLYEFGPEPMTTEAEQIDRATYEANVDRILGDLTSHNAAVYVALLDDQSKRPVAANPPNPTEPAFPATTAADLARMSVHVKAYNDIIRRKAAQYHATIADFNATTIFTDAATLYSDGNHPNSAGYDRIAAIWFAAMKPALK